MNPKDLRAYVNRDWARIDAVKRGRWRERRRRVGPQENFRVAGEIYLHARRIRPGGPSDQSRLADLESHAAVARRLRACPNRKPAA